MQIATWNVNSLKIRLPQVLAWLEKNPVDALCLQELKLTDEAFPLQAINDAGYQAVFAGQKTYNGVAILSKSAATDVVINNPHYQDEQRRVITATVDGVRLICAYIVNGQEVGSDKYSYKLTWLDAFHQFVSEQLQTYSHLAVLGDYNIAPADGDVHDPAQWHEKVLCSTPERERFNALLSLGLKDSFRLFEQAPKLYSWWDYRMMGFRRNAGLRIDHILLSDSLAASCTACVIDKEPRRNEQPSDHAPVVATINT